MLVNADEVKGVKEFKNKHQVVKNKKENDDLNKLSKPINDKNIEEREKFKFYANNWVKIRTDEDHIVFAKSMFYDENNGIGWIKNAEIFPGGDRDHTEMYTTKIDKTDNIYTLTDTTICPCRVFTDSNVDANRETPFNKLAGNSELLEKPLEANSIDNSDKEMHNKLKFKIVSTKSDKIIYNSDEKLLTFKHLWLRIAGVPLFYFPYYSMHTDNRGDTGMLIPTMTLLGKRQVGFEIPFYWKIRPDMDFLISRTQYFNLWQKGKYDGTNDARYKLKDLSKNRESTTQFRFRHLVSTNHAYQSFYKLEAMLVDPLTQLVDKKTGLGKVDDYNNVVKGYRWIIDFRTRLKLTKTTFLKANINWASDQNVLYYYKFDSRQIQENSIHLYDVNDNRYFSAEVLNYQSRLLTLDDKTLPFIIPVVRAEYDFKKDKLGGNIYLKSKAYYLNRDEGFNTATVGLDLGYHLPYFFKNGTKITFDTMAREQFNHIDYNAINSVAYLPHQHPRNNLLYYFGNYAGLVNGGYYANISQGFNKFTTLNFNKIQAEHPFVLLSKLGKTIITPKIAIRYSPNSGKNIYIPAEDNLSMQMHYYNAFELVQSEGYGIYDSGASTVYGIDFIHRFKRNIEIFGGLAQNLRMTTQLDEEVLAEYTGFRRSLSDLMGEIGLKLYGFSASSYFNYDVKNKEIRMFGAYTSYGNKYMTLSLNYNLFSKNATIFNSAFDMLTVSTKIKPFDKLQIIGSVRYNLKGLQTQYGWKPADFTYYSFGIYYTFSCLSIGFTLSENKFTLANTPNNMVYRFKVKFTGIG